MRTVIMSFIFFASFSLVATDMIDSLRGDQLIAYIIQQEESIKDCQKELKNVFIESFGKEYKPESSDLSLKGDSLVLSDIQTNKTLLTTTRDVVEPLYDAKEKLDGVIAETIAHIDQMIEDGASISPDKYGKTAADYCYTKEIYQALSKHKVSCSWQTWVYFNRIHVICACVATVGFLSVTKHAGWYTDLEKYIFLSGNMNNSNVTEQLVERQEDQNIPVDNLVDKVTSSVEVGQPNDTTVVDELAFNQFFKDMNTVVQNMSNFVAPAIVKVKEEIIKYEPTAFSQESQQAYDDIKDF